MSMDSAQETLIAIASASRRVIDASVAYARDKNDRNVDLSRARLGGELHRVVAASGTLLKETLQHCSSTHSPIDDRLKNWLFSDEPQACLDSLQTIEKLIRSSSGRVTSTFRNPFSSTPTDDKIKDAIRVFEKRRDCFHFLLTTDVWNHETAAKGPLRRGLVDTPITIQEIRLPDQDSTNTPVQAQASRTRRKVHLGDLNEILKWLDPWDCTAKHEVTLELRQPDTCTWLSDSDEYSAWRRTDDSFLWLHGKPGSGKSVLAASVIDGLERTLHDGESLAFFYCDFRSERSTAAAEVMRSLLSQLLRGFRDIGVDPGDVLDSLAKERRRNGSILSNAKRLAVLVSRAAKRFTRQPLVVVDALDECEDIESLLNALRVLNQGGVRLFVISRPLQVIKDSFPQLPWLSLENMSREVSADIKLHIRRVLDSHRRLRIAGAILKEEIIRSLNTNAGGMFRWIECQLNTLKRCVTTVEIREALESLPIGLDATYERILLEISKEERGGAIVERVLVWLVVAFTPLRLCQIIEALSIDLDRRTLNPDVGPIHGHALLDTLGSLVMYDEEADIVKLSHFSVKEYLLGKFSYQKRLYHIDQQDAHAQVVRQCMSYIGACLELEQGSYKELHPLLDYVLSCGFIHLGHITPTRSILDAILALHSDVQRHPLQWERMHKGANNLDPGRGLPSLKDDFVLFILIRYAPELLLRLFLGRAPLRAKEGTNPLNYAVHKIEHAQTLLSRGAKLDRRGIFTIDYSHDCISCLPIEAAVREGDRTLMDLLLAAGSPIPSGLFSAALLEEGRSTFHAHAIARLLQTDEFVEWATYIHDKGLLLRALDHRRYTRSGWPIKEDVVVMTRRLKQIGCDLNGRSSFVERLFRRAVMVGHISTIEYFLSELKASLPPDILLEASRSKFFNGTTIRFLVRNGANVHVVSADETTALHLVTGAFGMENCLEMTKILCEAGSDPSACNLEGETPMHLIASCGYVSVVKYLLSVGAPLPPDIMLRTTPRGSTGPSMIRLLLEKGANATVLSVNGDTVLHSALLDYSEAWDNCLESARILLAAGCDPGIPNSVGQTALDVAVASGHVPVVKYLLSLNTPLSSGILLSALGRSYVGRINLPMIKFLLDNGANIHVTTPDGDNALHCAVRAGYTWWDNDNYIQAVKILMDAGCDPSARNSDGETLFHVAVRHRRTNVIEYIFSQGVPLPSDILLAISYNENNSQTIQYLIDKGADVRAVAADGNTPLHFAVHSTSESSSLNFAKILIDAGSDPSVLNSSYETPMHTAANEGYISVIDHLLSLCVPLPRDILLTASASHSWVIAPVVRFVIAKGADATIVTTNGNTALHLALARSGGKEDRLETTKILIGAGCDIHALNSAGETPLCAAARGGHIAIIEYLASQGASLPPNAFLAAASCVESKAQTVRFLATLEGADVHAVAPNGDTVLHRAVASSDDEDCLETAKVLIGLGCDPSLRNLAGETPLHISVRRHQLSVTKYLLSQGIPLPFDVLLSAALRGHDSRFPSMGPMMRFLIREGANPCVAKDSGDSDTPLHVVLRYDIGSSMWGWNAIQILLDGGANPYARNLDGQTPVDLAEMAGPFFLKNFMRLVKNAEDVPRRDLVSSSEMIMSTKP